MNARVYLETTVVSHLTARPSRDVVQIAHQQITHDWWAARSAGFAFFVSELVAREAAAGDPEAAAARLRFLENLPALEVNEQATKVAEAILADGAIPPSAADDAMHLALAAVHGVDYLVTWNCRHLANAETRDRLAEVIRRCGHVPPRVCTPEELMGAEP